MFSASPPGPATPSVFSVSILEPLPVPATVASVRLLLPGPLPAHPASSETADAAPWRQATVSKNNKSIIVSQFRALQIESSWQVGRFLMSKQGETVHRPDAA